MDLIPVPADGSLPVGAMAMAFAGGLALFLHGMEGVTAGLKGLAGGSLSRLLARLSGNRITGALTGIGGTATIQSVEQLSRSVPTVVTGTSDDLLTLAQADEDIDDLHAAILSYLRRIDDESLTDAQRQQFLDLMDVSRYVEIVGDIVQHEPQRIAAYARGTETIERLRTVYTYAKRIARTVPGVQEPPRQEAP